MVTTIYNITRDMQTISCYVDNGYGTPMQVKEKLLDFENYVIIMKNLV